MLRKPTSLMIMVCIKKTNTKVMNMYAITHYNALGLIANDITL